MEAISLYDDSRALLEQVSLDGPNSALLRHELYLTHFKIGDVYYIKGDYFQMHVTSQRKGRITTAQNYWSHFVRDFEKRLESLETN